MAREPGIFPYNDMFNDNLRTSGTLESSPDTIDVSVLAHEPINIKPLRGTMSADYVGDTEIIYTETTYHNVLTGTY
jgi:hypothetical protein